MNTSPSRAGKRPISDVPGIVGSSGMVGVFLGASCSFLFDFSIPLTVFLLLAAAAFPMLVIEAWLRGVSIPDLKSWRTESVRPCYASCLGAVSPWLLTLSLFQLFSPEIISDLINLLLTSFGITVVLLYLLKQTFFPDREHRAAWGMWVDRGYPLRGFPVDRFRDGLVKAFFIPLMLSFVTSWSRPDLSLSNPIIWSSFPVAVLYLIDTIFGTIGYFSTSKSLGSHVRSSNPYLQAWFVALLCYPPFIGVLHERLGLDYHHYIEWYQFGFLSGSAGLVWGGLIILLTLIYAWSTVAFGIRFSNLTYRGVITNGPYRFSRHPAYLAKNLSWWMTALPFLALSSTRLRVFLTLCLLALNAVYWARAITEEHHLLRYRKYRTYWRYIESRRALRLKKSPFKGLKRYPVFLPVILFLLAFAVKPDESLFVKERIAGSLYRAGITGSSTFVSSDSGDGEKIDTIRSSLLIEDSGVNAEDSFPIASLTKPLTGFAVQKVFKKGMLSPDPLSGEVITPLAGSPLGKIRIADLLMHRSGVEDRGLLEDKKDGRGCERSVASYGQVAKISNEKKMEYANINYCLLTLVVEDFYGKDIYGVFQYLARDLLTGNDNGPVKFSCDEYSWLKGAGGACLAPSEAFRVLSHVAKNQIIPSRHGKEKNDPWNYGYGWRVWDARDRVFLSHYGLIDNHFSLAVFDLNGEGYLLLAEERPSQPSKVADQITKILIDTLSGES